jgi:hypothetical protein
VVFRTTKETCALHTAFAWYVCGMQRAYKFIQATQQQTDCASTTVLYSFQDRALL